jgi:ABC-2 type transport system ATP-binding protein
MADVESLCKRIVLINEGELRYDGHIDGLASTLLPYKLIRVEIAPGTSVDWSQFGEVVESEDAKASFRVLRQEVPDVAAHLLASLPVADLSVTDPPLESVIDKMYRGGMEP